MGTPDQKHPHLERVAGFSFFGRQQDWQQPRCDGRRRGRDVEEAGDGGNPSSGISLGNEPEDLA
jgi:hypothetical protein